MIVARKISDVKMELPGLTVVVAGASSLNEGRNIGAAGLKTDLITFIDDDNVLASDALEKMAEPFDDSRIAAVSPLIFDRSGGIWFAGMSWTRMGLPSISKKIPEGPALTESFHDVFMVRRKAFEQVGGFDSERFPFYLGEADLAERMKKLGYHFVVNPESKVWHDIEPIKGLKSIVRGSHIGDQKRAYFVGRNRLLFLHLHYPGRFLFYLLVLPVFATVHILSMVANRKFDYIGLYLKGVRDGL